MLLRVLAEKEPTEVLRSLNDDGNKCQSGTASNDHMGRDERQQLKDEAAQKDREESVS